jgi:L-lactate dehydrogenase complex protein LldG
MERDAFLARVRAARSTGRLPAAAPVDPDGPEGSAGDHLAAFVDAVRRVDGVVHEGDPLEAMRRIVERHGPGSHLAWDRELLAAPETLDVLAGAGPRLDPILPPDAGSPIGRALSDVVYGLTGAEAAFAESGTIVVRSGKGRPRMASLVPLVHVALVPTDRIFRSLSSWAASDASGMAAASNVVFVTGPSRTGDIEQEITLGVHGPRYLHLVLVTG